MAELRANAFAERLNIEHILTTSPPPQDQVLPGLLAGTAGLMVGPGGVGKTMFELQIALAIASGESVCGGLFESQSQGAVMAHAPGKVVLVLAEESVGVVWHRLHAIVATLAGNARMRCTQCSPAELLELWSQNLHIYTLDGQAPTQLMDGGYASTQAVSDLTKVSEGARLVMLDPLRQFHSCDENDSAAMTSLTHILREIAFDSGAAVTATHHTNRASSNQGMGDTAGASRGSTALTDGVRWQLNLSALTRDAAKLHGIDEAQRNRYLLVDLPKANYLAPQKPALLERLAGGVLVLAEEAESRSPVERASANKSAGGRQPSTRRSGAQ
ncbi:MAG: AAA family ATPase [Burkholderiaceae bacterium]|nr:AAA family ATPase [Burkholderiaceae bacterium]